MKKYCFYFLLFLGLLLSFNDMKAQGGMRFPELAKKLEPYFDDELIADIKNQLPQQSSYAIWGWDVGDFSGDGFNDVAIAVKFASEKKKIVQVMLFVDVDGYLNPVGQFPYEYFELPLEIGVSIKENACYVTRKIEQFDWYINGYRFDNGSLMLLDEFHTRRIDKFTHESYTNYCSLMNWDKYIQTKSGETSFYTDYLVLPSYYRGRLVYRGYSSELYVNNPNYVYEGAFNWSSDDDASFYVKSAYDEEYLYLTFNVHDDIFVPERTKDQPADYLQLWFDFSDINKKDSREISKIKDNSIQLRETADSGIFSLKIYPGDFRENKPYIKELVSSNELDEDQQAAVSKIKAAASKNQKGYIIKLRIPFKLFGFDAVPIENDKISYIGFSAVFNDIDNEFRPEEVTKIATSRLIPNNPSSFGTLMLIPNTTKYGESSNIYRDDVLKCINELGF